MDARSGGSRDAKYGGPARTPPGRTMTPASWVEANLGLTVLSVISLALVLYLAWVMVHPERF